MTASSREALHKRIRDLESRLRRYEDTPEETTDQKALEAISILFFGPISALGARFQFTKDRPVPAVETHATSSIRRGTARPPYLYPES